MRKIGPAGKRLTKPCFEYERPSHATQHFGTIAFLERLFIGYRCESHFNTKCAISTHSPKKPILALGIRYCSGSHAVVGRNFESLLTMLPTADCSCFRADVLTMIALAMGSKVNRKVGIGCGYYCTIGRESMKHSYQLSWLIRQVVTLVNC
jgi:hypothetical protein